MNNTLFPYIKIVEASAGSGKTYALAKQYVSLLMNPNISHDNLPIKSILAITFTNKSMLEMKNRIIDFLKKIAFNQFNTKEEEQDILSSICLTKNEASKKACVLIDMILNNYSFFHIQTIDSFMKMIISSCSFCIGFNTIIDIKTDPTEYWNNSFDLFFDSLKKEKEQNKIFENFLFHYLYVENKENWISKKDIINKLLTLFSYTNIYGKNFDKIKDFSQAVFSKKQIIFNNIKLLSECIPDNTHLTFKKWIKIFAKTNNTNFTIKELSNFFKKTEFPLTKSKKNEENNINNKIFILWDQIRKHIIELCEIESIAAFCPYIEIFNSIFDIFKKNNIKDNIIFLEELNKYTQSIFFDKTITMSELYCRLATKFRHYLIDEFQDTSNLQWNNLYPMVKEAIDSGGSLFYVGDKKQAIYSFRGGNSALFDSVADIFNKYNIKKEILVKNYRSSKNIIMFNNEIFSEKNIQMFLSQIQYSNKKIVLSKNDMNKIINVFKNSYQIWNEKENNGYIYLERLEQKENNIKEKLLHIIEDITKRFNYADIAILVRNNQQIKLVSTYLLENNIPIESEKTLNIQENIIIKEIIAFLKFLDSPIDNLSFAFFIMSNIFINNTSLEKEEINNFLFQNNSKTKEKTIYLYQTFKKKYPDIWNNFIKPFLDNLEFIPLYELVISIFSQFNILSIFKENQAFFMKFLEFIKQNESNFYNIPSFLEIFKNAQEKDISLYCTIKNAIKIITIHKAKGLEFPVVINPFVEMNINIGIKEKNSNRSYIIKTNIENHISLFQIKQDYLEYSNRLNNAYKKEYIEKIIEELNVIYVSTTRAIYEMYLFIPEKTANKNNIANILFSKNITKGIKSNKKISSNKEKKKIFLLPVSNYSNWINFLKSKTMDLSHLFNRENIQKGEILHAMLSCIENLYYQNKKDIIKKMQIKIRNFHLQNITFTDYFNKIEKIIENKHIKKIFFIQKGQIYNEQDFIDEHGETKRIDRLIILDKELWIIDYKSSKHAFKNQKKQIIEYINIMKQIYPKLIIKGFIIYFDTITIEEINYE